MTLAARAHMAAMLLFTLFAAITIATGTLTTMPVVVVLIVLLLVIVTSIWWVAEGEDWQDAPNIKRFDY